MHKEKNLCTEIAVLGAIFSNSIRANLHLKLFVDKESSFLDCFQIFSLPGAWTTSNEKKTGRSRTYNPNHLKPLTYSKPKELKNVVRLQIKRLVIMTQQNLKERNRQQVANKTLLNLKFLAASFLAATLESPPMRP